MSTSPIRPGGRKLPARPSSRGVGRTAAPAHAPAGGSTRPEDSVGTRPQVEVKQAGDPEQRRAALHAHVEQALVGIFGSRLVSEPRVQDIVCQTVEALLAEPALEEEVQAVCRVGVGGVEKE